MSSSGDTGEQILTFRRLDQLPSDVVRGTATALVAVLALAASGCGVGRGGSAEHSGDGPVAVTGTPDRFRIDPSADYSRVEPGTLVPIEKATLTPEEVLVLINGGTLSEADRKIDMVGDQKLSYLIDNLVAGDTLQANRILDETSAAVAAGFDPESQDFKDSLQSVNGGMLSALLQVVRKGVKIDIRIVSPRDAGTAYKPGDWAFVGLRAAGDAEALPQ